MQRAQLLGLYKRILRNAKAFPSVRRDRMVQEIREGASMLPVSHFLMSASASPIDRLIDSIGRSHDPHTTI